MPKGKNGDTISRRSFLALGAGAAVATLFADPLAAAMHAMPERSLMLYNTHTGEQLRTTYWAGGRYLPDSLASAFISWLCSRSPKTAVTTTTERRIQRITTWPAP